MQFVVSRIFGIAALAAGIAGCGAATGEDNVSNSSEALSSPVDPVTFCKASGLNVIIGTQRNDVITGTAAADCIVGLGGQDTINAGAGDDIIFAGEGDDVVNAGDGNDQVFAGPGQDNLQGGPGNDSLNGEDGDDLIHGGDGDDTLSGGQGQDRLFGDAGNDKLNGDVGDDQLQGGDGDDALSDCSNRAMLARPREVRCSAARRRSTAWVRRSTSPLDSSRASPRDTVLRGRRRVATSSDGLTPRADPTTRSSWMSALSDPSSPSACSTTWFSPNE